MEASKLTKIKVSKTADKERPANISNSTEADKENKVKSYAPRQVASMDIFGKQCGNNKQGMHYLLLEG